MVRVDGADSTIDTATFGERGSARIFNLNPA
jgi:hypothetical protein